MSLTLVQVIVSGLLLGAGVTLYLAWVLGTALGLTNYLIDAQIPDRDLAKAVFAAPLDAVTDPVKGALSWYVVRVSAATAGEDPDFDAARERVREKVAADKAADLMYERANKVDALLAELKQSILEAQASGDKPMAALGQIRLDTAMKALTAIRDDMRADLANVR